MSGPHTKANIHGVKIGTIADIQDGWADANQIGGEG